MEKYLFEFNTPVGGSSNFQASVPARRDVITTFVSTGGHFINCNAILDIHVPKLRGLLWDVSIYAKAIIALPKIRKGTQVYFQYPYYRKASQVLLRKMVRYTKNKGAYITLILHDLNFLRYEELPQNAIEEIKFLNEADRLLVHTQRMKERLLQLGITTKMDVMVLFDYYAKDPYRNLEEQVNDRFVIAFAGNLNKSQFLRKLDESEIPSEITFHFYGYQPQIEFRNPRIDYQGKFLPEHTGTIHAGWGLVWDGDSIKLVPVL